MSLRIASASLPAPASAMRLLRPSSPPTLATAPSHFTLHSLPSENALRTLCETTGVDTGVQCHCTIHRRIEHTHTHTHTHTHAFMCVCVCVYTQVMKLGVQCHHQPWRTEAEVIPRHRPALRHLQRCVPQCMHEDASQYTEKRRKSRMIYFK